MRADMITIIASIFILLCGIMFLTMYVVLKGELWQQVLNLFIGILCISYSMAFTVKYLT
ncbi:MAG: hypothetical protein IKF82_00270 [Bacilli bacterium]|nr:hypothetical protein [Bacilli bacterium]